MSERTRGLATMLVIGIGGVVALVMGWLYIARTLLVPLQVPALISGGLAGLAMVGAAALLVNALLQRYADGRRSAELDALLDEAAALVASAPKLRARVARKGRRR